MFKGARESASKSVHLLVAGVPVASGGLKFVSELDWKFATKRDEEKICIGHANGR